MLRLRMIAAAALMSIMMPAIAAASPALDSRAKYLVQLRAEITANRDRIRTIIVAHRGDRAKLSARLAELNSRLTELRERIAELRERQASA